MSNTKDQPNKLGTMLQGPRLPQVESLVLLPSTATGEIVDWIEYYHKPEEIRESLNQIITAIIEEYDIKCIAIDCRAGPDPLSLAVAGISTYTIIVSEPDIVTWDGTLNLHRYILNEYKEIGEVVFLLNKVPKKYELEKLESDYTEKLSTFLKSLRILAYIPFDYDIFESFGERRFVIDDFPNAILCRKLASLAKEFFGDSYSYLLPENINLIETGTIRGVPKSRRAIRRRTSRLLMIIGGAYTLAGLLLLGLDEGGLLPVPSLVPLIVVLVGVIIVFWGWFRSQEEW